MAVRHPVLRAAIGPTPPPRDARAIHVIADETDSLPEGIKAWIQASKAAGGVTKPVTLVPDESGHGVAAAVLDLGKDANPLVAGRLAKALPVGAWHFAPMADTLEPVQVFLGYLLGAYRFDAYRKKATDQSAIVSAPDSDGDGGDVEQVIARAAAVYTVRDLVNTPANDMGPADIEAAARDVARAHKATLRCITGHDLLKKDFPLIHAVGRAAAQEPRLIDFKWGRRGAPKVTLVGKGVAYDTGGLDIKPASAMRNMKKDMGGAAHVLGLAMMIMDAKLDVRLRVLIPAVENSISADAFRPGDVYPSRKGMTVEIGNTDAEGRLVLADVLTLADEESPELLIDFATLTGAARVALGPDIAPFYTASDAVAQDLSDASVVERDPVWRMPLWDDYAKGLSSNVADCCNITTDGMAGSITAALFLKKFVENAETWMHFDVYAWSPSGKAHAPAGGEAQGIRALMTVLQRRYAVRTKA
ncbi:MAG: leucyl aminopeptidase family protein [Pseudomonadota bacterium]